MGGSLRFIPEEFMTEKLCKIAIINSHIAINYVPEELFNDLLKFTISQHKNILKYISEFLNEEICLYAIKHCNYTIDEIPSFAITQYIRDFVSKN